MIKLASVVVYAAVLISAVLCNEDGFAGFTYGSQATWGDSCNSNSGHQSPIDIISPTQTSVVAEPLQVPAVCKNVTLTPKEDDHSIKFAFPAAEGDEFDFIVPIANISTTALQLHLHWGGSEHLVNAMRYVLECHLVTSAVDHTAEDQIIISVFARLFELGDANPTIEKLISAHEDDIEEVQEFDLFKLYPSNIENVFVYRGSLTTPPCTEGVQWTVVEETLTVSPEQLLRLKTLQLATRSLKQNFRSVQSVNDRTVERYNLQGNSAATTSLSAVLLAAILFIL